MEMLREGTSCLILLILWSCLSNTGFAVDGIQLRQTFYHSDSDGDGDYVSAVETNAGDVGYDGRSQDPGGDYDGGEAGYEDDDGGGSRKKGGSGGGKGRGHDEDGYESQRQPDRGVHEPRSYRDNYEPLYERKAKQPSRGYAYNDEYDDDDDDDDHGHRRGYNKKPKKKKIKPKVIIVKKIIPLSTTTAVNG